MPKDETPAEVHSISRADVDLPEPTTAPGTDIGQAEVQATVDAEEEQGFRGTNPDPTPNAAYTVSGVLAGTPTPETTPQMRDRNPAPAKEK